MSVAAPAAQVASSTPSRRVGGDWAPLRYFTGYRAIVATLFVAIALGDATPSALGGSDPVLFWRVAVFYELFSLACVVAAQVRRPGFETQVVVQTFVDIVALTLLMHASGGLSSGFGMLLVVAIAGGSILSYGRIAVLFAALASLAVLAEQIVVTLDRSVSVGDYTHGGLLGLTFFTTALLAHFAARRVRASETLAARRAVDLANLAQLNEHIIERMQSGIVVLDELARVYMFNASAQHLLGLRGADRGRPMSALEPALWALHERWLQAPGQSTFSLRAAASGRDVAVSFAALPGRQTDAAVLLFVEDASAMYQRAQQLKLASLGRLTASIAHEIRNPLSAVSHAGDLLAEEPELGPGGRRMLAIMRTNTRRMNDIIESVLQLSRRAPSEPRPLEARPWLEAFAGEFGGGRAGVQRLDISVEPPDLCLQFDPGQLRQVLWNLCENSLRHGGDGVAIQVRAGLGDDGVRPFLEVEDDGPGLAADVAEHVFEPFVTTRGDGSGLGLYLSRELCEANQASLAFLPGRAGACFRIIFADPRRQRPVATPVSSAPAGVEG